MIEVAFVRIGTDACIVSHHKAVVRSRSYIADMLEMSKPKRLPPMTAIAVMK